MYCLTLLFLELKRILRTPAKLLCLLFLLATTSVLGCLLPADAPPSLTIGVFPQGTLAQETLRILIETADYQTVRYDSAEQLKRDVLSGRLHCGYHIYESEYSSKPVTVYGTQSSYLQPLLNQLVLSAYFEASLPHMTQDAFEKYGFSADANEALQKQHATANAMTIEIRTLGKETAVAPTISRSMQPLAYAVLISLFFAAAMLQALLLPTDIVKAHRQLSVLSGHAIASRLAPAAAEVLFWTGTLLLADGALNSFLEGDAYYPLMARVSVFLLLAIGAALLCLAACALRKNSFALLVLLPVWLIGSIFFSGALLSPALFPLGLGGLRFLSPAWYALQWLNLF